MSSSACGSQRKRWIEIQFGFWKPNLVGREDFLARVPVNEHEKSNEALDGARWMETARILTDAALSMRHVMRGQLAALLSTPL
jgi:hypothetical protein